VGLGHGGGVLVVQKDYDNVRKGVVILREIIVACRASGNGPVCI
jgi:hypothetical protein